MATADFPTEMTAFLEGWREGLPAMREAFQAYAGALAAHEGVRLSFKARPGVTYSLRARHAAQQARELFALVDVVDDDPDGRWLSVCFYDDMVTDPEELGDMVPGGLMGENARCFNLDGDDARMRSYIAARLDEAAASAALPK